MAHGAATQPKCRTCGERHLMGPCPQRGVSRSVERRLATQTTDVSQKRLAPVEQIVSTVSTKRSDAERVREWRTKNRERYNASMRAWRKRAKEQAG